ncbi:MBL fold metallo-hydrolase [Pseudonocardia hydrocarbonoxydans]|uniref:MBL fold metallo-hydrolase n=1 Tax=Pseudonocardia hydrocarbonoxydans TaxID=76726 RepID=A0A4Y3WMR7_9PSEU|nr:MBL fold metallo-hydrolase [Pseudonocardia hydrocarbonoxydans]GEC20105.1 MBL fold metallo-hydrolase [Pseudonocardia hydrocarbonoxydans]
MEITAFRTPGLGDTSYLLEHEGRAVLVDPQRDVDRFLARTAERDLEVRMVLETHLHNDYASGAGQLARLTGAELVLPAAAAPAYPGTPAFHHEDIDAGRGLTVRPLHTPGHTPEHTSYLVLVDGEPVAVFSGGSLLVGSAGRPDLLGPERAHTLGVLQHGSVHRLARLPRAVGLYPTHGEGSFCTVSGAGTYTSTIGAERDGNPMLALPDADAFAERLLAEPMPIPDFYRFQGPANILGVPPMPPVDVPELPESALAAPAVTVVDIRSRDAQAAGYVPGAVGVELAEDFGSWAGWLVPRGRDIVLVAAAGQDVPDAVTQLARIGVDTVRGVVHDPSPRVATQTFELLDLDGFAAHAGRPGAQLLDVRMPHERAREPLPGAAQRFVPDLRDGAPAGLDPARPVLVACGSGRRAAIAATLLAAHGYRSVVLTGAGAPDVAARRAEHAAV